MAPELVPSSWRRSACVALALLAMLAELDAQGGGARNRGRGRQAPPPVDLTPPTPPQNLLPIYLPGFDSAPAGGKRGKGLGPVGPRPQPKPAAKAPPVPRPVDPMKAADEVTAQESHRSAQEEAEQARLAEHFRICDLDGNGWLSLREAEVTLSLDRVEYRRTDRNQDGRIDAREFAAEKGVLLARLGALPAPASELTLPTLPTQTAPADPDSTAEPALAAPDAQPESGEMRVMPGEILRRYDLDGSKGIAPAELEKFLREVGLALSPELVIAQMDPDDSGELEASELVAIAWMASQHLPKALLSSSPEREQTATASLPEGEPASDDSVPGAETPPARTVAGLTHFARLDADGNGFIDEADLRKLQSPARVDVRLKAVLSALDRDGDARLSEAEFRASMNDEPR